MEQEEKDASAWEAGVEGQAEPRAFLVGGRSAYIHRQTELENRIIFPGNEANRFRAELKGVTWFQQMTPSTVTG